MNMAQTDQITNKAVRVPNIFKISGSSIRRLFLVFLIALLPAAESIPCSRSRFAEWHESVKNVTISWALDEVCTTYEECYGVNDPDVQMDPQLCPVEMQFGDRLVILPQAISSQGALPANVSLADFNSCPSDSHPSSQWLVPSSTISPIEVSPDFLPLGLNYFRSATHRWCLLQLPVWVKGRGIGEITWLRQQWIRASLLWTRTLPHRTFQLFSVFMPMWWRIHWEVLWRDRWLLWWWSLCKWGHVYRYFSRTEWQWCHL